MKLTICITTFVFIVVALLVAIALKRRQNTRKLQEYNQQFVSTRVFEPGSDPVKDRIEFHLRKKE